MITPGNETGLLVHIIATAPPTPHWKWNGPLGEHRDVRVFSGVTMPKFQNEQLSFWPYKWLWVKTNGTIVG